MTDNRLQKKSLRIQCKMRPRFEEQMQDPYIYALLSLLPNYIHLTIFIKPTLSRLLVASPVHDITIRGSPNTQELLFRHITDVSPTATFTSHSGPQLGSTRNIFRTKKFYKDKRDLLTRYRPFEVNCKCVTEFLWPFKRNRPDSFTTSHNTTAESYKIYNPPTKTMQQK